MHFAGSRIIPLLQHLRIQQNRIKCWPVGAKLKARTNSSSSSSSSASPNIVTGPWDPIPVATSLPLTDLMLDRFREQPTKTALVNGSTGERFTFGQLGHLVCTLAAGLAKQGLTKGDNLALSAPNSIEAALLLMAVPATGATLTLLNPGLVSEEVEKLLGANMPEYLVTTPSLLERFSKMSSQMKKVFTISNADGHMSVQDVIDSAEGYQTKSPDIDPCTHPGIIHYSSGTTGLPKGVLLSHHNLTSAIIAASSPGIDLFLEKDISILIFPLAHAAGSIISMLTGLYSLSTQVVFPQFDFKDYLQACQKYKATFLFLPPPVVVRMLSDPLMLNFDASSVERVLSGAAPVSAHVQRELLEKLKIKTFRQAYGMTEMAGLTHLDDTFNVKEGSAGMAIPNVFAKIVDPDTEETLPPTSTGELWMSGPQAMLGYLNRPGETSVIKTEDGWIKTGDIGYHDEEGSLYIIDRKKDLIKYKSHQVAPAELEGILLEHPMVIDAAVIGVDDTIAGEVPRAYVVLSDPAHAGSRTENDILQFVADHVAPYKRIRGGIRFVSSIPKLPSGKILKRVIRDRDRS